MMTPRTTAAAGLSASRGRRVHRVTVSLAAASALGPSAGRPSNHANARRGNTSGRGGSKGGDHDESEWMQRARKLANQRAAQFRKERGAQPVASPGTWRRKRKEDKAGAEGFGDLDAARGYDAPSRRGRDDSDAVEMTATAGDGLWRVDMAGLGEEDFATQFSMTLEDWGALKRTTKASATDPLSALRAFEDAGLRRVSPDIAAGMLDLIAQKAQNARCDREELAGLRRDPRLAHLLGTCVAAARRGSEALGPKSVSQAAWALAVISGERANSAEMEVLADRAAALVDKMSTRSLVNLTWACASCRHAAPSLFQAIDVHAAVNGLKGLKPFDVSSIVWAFAHLGHSCDGLIDGIDQWFSGGAIEEIGADVAAAHAKQAAAQFSPAALVNAAWALAVIGGDGLRSSGFRALWAEICARGEADAASFVPGEQMVFGAWRGKHLNQVHQVSMSVDAAGGTDALGLVPMPDALAAAADGAWHAQRRPPVVSWYQRDVSSILSYMGEKHEEEAVCGGYRVDLFIPNPTGILDAELKEVAASGVAVEVDGPMHFARNDTARALGQTRLKHRQLRHLGYAVLSVPVAEWEYMESADEKVEFLREEMDRAVRLAADAASA